MIITRDMTAKEQERKQYKLAWLQKLDKLKIAISKMHPMNVIADPIAINTTTTIIGGHPDYKYVHTLSQRIRFKKYRLTKEEMEKLNTLWNKYR